MRIAIPTNDGATVSAHFGRSAAFLVFEVEQGQIQSREMRSNAGQHAHEQGSCGADGAHREAHSHAGIVSSLNGCDVVICAGMGRGAAEALRSGGITTVVTGTAASPEEMVKAYLSGRLSAGQEGLCRCSH